MELCCIQLFPFTGYISHVHFLLSLPDLLCTMCTGLLPYICCARQPMCPVCFPSVLFHVAAIGCYTIPALSKKGKNAFLIFYPFKLQNLDNDWVIQVPEKRSQSVSVMCTLEFKAAVSLLAVEDNIIWLNEALSPWPRCKNRWNKIIMLA